MIQFTTFPTREAAMQAAADVIAESLENGLKSRGEACAALSGGSTPAPAYRALAQRSDLNWEKITFALVDERCVPPAHEASNERLIGESLAAAFERGAQLKPMYFDTPTFSEAADCASSSYQDLAIDVALMGMGDDGHTASWFPNAEGLSEALDLNTKAPVIAIHAPQAASTANRLTLTRATIARADRVILLITGEQKRRVLEAAASGPIEAAPVAALFSGRQPQVIWAP